MGSRGNNTREESEKLTAFNRVCVFILLVVVFALSTGFNRDRDPSKAECLDCHDDIKELMNKKHVHYPVEAKQCDACHDSETFGLKEKGSALCTVCHRDFAKEEAMKTVHPVVDECTTCHSPHASDNAPLLVDRVPALCFTCHEGFPVGERPASVHAPFEDGACGDCHNPHTSPNPSLLIGGLWDLCTTCHDATDPGFNKAHLNLLTQEADCLMCHKGHYSTKEGLVLENAHAPFTEGLCDSCHVTPEGGAKAALVASGPELCLTCHGDMDASLKSKFVHLPAEESCLNCHEPHAAPQSPLLKETGVALCGQCHADNVTVVEGMKAHEPFSKGQCTDCHDSHGSENAGILAAPEKDLCLTCHAGVAESLIKVHPHTAVEQGCVACHQAHMAQSATLLKDEGAPLCFRCHESRAQRVSRFVHYPYREGNCATCHRPHGGVSNGNLVMDVEQLCTMCHPSRHKSFPHPTGVKPSAELEIPPDNRLHFTRDDTLVCATCHAPHTADVVFLLRVGVIGGDLCYQCHQR
ncbi:MAG: hypothetical protein C4532_05995 [Candidatus Abyssobacteria bacterium SURF_17]|uniref:Doubled CXXCH motif domain-containing protein n=1 Tax=Candidatus Abyssobacteria bacterium SURF_17 TaxID=2093361 RepID=A0A419F243_9BACT|nr:MAG: hypothetical protein C4532_05995 [Candidatus Abyssubacteria bacterium SURF_17]